MRVTRSIGVWVGKRRVHEHFQQHQSLQLHRQVQVVTVHHEGDQGSNKKAWKAPSKTRILLWKCSLLLLSSYSFPFTYYISRISYKCCR